MTLTYIPAALHTDPLPQVQGSPWERISALQPFLLSPGGPSAESGPQRVLGAKPRRRRQGGLLLLLCLDSSALLLVRRQF